MTRDHMQAQWNELQRVLRWMLNDEHWPMRPSPKVCRLCPYYQTTCKPTIPCS